MQNESFIWSLILKWVWGENQFLFKTIKFSVESWKSEVFANFIVATCKSKHSNGAEHTLQRPVSFNANKTSYTTLHNTTPVSNISKKSNKVDVSDLKFEPNTSRLFDFFLLIFEIRGSTHFLTKVELIPNLFFMITISFISKDHTSYQNRSEGNCEIVIKIRAERMRFHNCCDNRHN